MVFPDFSCHSISCINYVEKLWLSGRSYVIILFIKFIILCKRDGFQFYLKQQGSNEVEIPRTLIEGFPSHPPL